MITMRPIRTIATALLVASLAAAGCGTSQPDQPTTPPSQPPVVTAPPPCTPEPDPRPPGPTARPRILSVTTTPTLPREGGFLRLPTGTGKVVFQVRRSTPSGCGSSWARPAPTPRPGCSVRTPTAMTGGPWSGATRTNP